MDIVANLTLGLGIALSPHSLLFVFIGACVGTVFGAFPGLSAPTAIAMLLPLTFGLDPTTGIIMLAGIYYGSQYGNSISAVLLGIPGDSAAVVTAIEGGQLARQGRAGHALTVAAVSSFSAGIIGTVIMMLAGPGLAWLAIEFGPPEYFAVMLLAFCMLPAFASEGRIKMFASLAVGIALATVGIDQFNAAPRFTFGHTALFEGIPFVPAIIGLFGIADVLYMSGLHKRFTAPAAGVSFRQLFPSMADWLHIKWTILRSSLLGFAVGVLPGAGATIAAFAAYAMERAISKTPKSFGTGKLDGLAAGEAGNSGASIGAMVPLIALGIPGSGATAVMLGGFLIWGLQPGPMLFQSNPEFVWGLIASMLIGNMFLLVMNVFLVPVYARVLRVPYTILAPVIIVFCSVGAYSTNTNFYDVWIMFGFGLLGYLFNLLRIPVAPLVLGLVLGRMVEAKLRQSLSLSDTGVLIFFERPISASVIVIAALLVVVPPLLDVYRRRAAARRTPAEEQGRERHTGGPSS